MVVPVTDPARAGTVSKQKSGDRIMGEKHRTTGTNLGTNPRTETLPPSTETLISRRRVLRTAAMAGGSIAVGTLHPFDLGAARAAAAPAPEAGSPDAGTGDLQPRDAVTGILSAMDRFPLVGIGERHLLQEVHDLLTTLLINSALPSKITDIVVEFGNSLHQDIADRFILSDAPISTTDLAQIWRFTIGGDILWDAPVYERFFRTVRAINWGRPRKDRIRVLLGDPPYDHRRVRGLADKNYVVSMIAQRDAFYAGVVEKEVLSKGRRALLIAGSNHLLRGLHGNEGAQGLNAATRLMQAHPNALYVIDTLVFPPGPAQDPLIKRAQAAVKGWPRPAVASLAGTWLGATTQSVAPWINSAAYLAATPSAVRYGAQADAILYVGPPEALTASQPDPTLYQSGSYRDELRRLSRLYTQSGQATDYVADGLKHAQAGPGWFDQFGGSK
jgi:hypothetical protein